MDFLVTLDGWKVEHFLAFDFGAGKGEEKWKKKSASPYYAFRRLWLTPSKVYTMEKC